MVHGEATFAHPAVGRLGPSRCTATLIHPQAVLTAAHCVDDEGAQQFVIETELGDLYVPITEVTSHPRYHGRSQTGQSHDLAVAILAHPVHAVAIPEIMTERQLRIGDTVRLIGYGWTDYEGTLPEQKHTGLADVDAISSLWIQLRREEGEAQSCPGDSGSPYLHPETGMVVAVHARGTCRSGGTSSKGAPVWRHHAWIQDQVDAGIREDLGVALHPLIFDDELYAHLHPELDSPGERRWHWLNVGLAAGERGSATFDPAFYVASMGGGASFEDAAAQWLDAGLDAGHPGAREVDAAYLVGQIHDWPFAADSYRTALEHYLHRGLEHRASAAYDPVFYMSTYDDWHELGLTYRAALAHYLEVGKPSGRPGAQ